MADYTPITDFAAKDSLATGNPNKRILGSEFGAEYNAVSTAIATKADKVTSPTVGNLHAMDSAGNLIDSGLAAAGVGSLIEVEVFTSSGTWNKPSGCNKVIVTVVGGGGGSGGNNPNAGWTTVAGAGGGGGGVLAYIDSGLGSSETVTIGAAGAAGGIGLVGGAGGNSSFGSFATANGGGGGGGINYLSGTVTAGGGSGGSTSTSGVAAEVRYNGRVGEDGYSVNSITAPAFSSAGGRPSLGLGQEGSKKALVISGGVNPGTPTGYGSGAGGRVLLNTGTPLGGFAGLAGIVVVRSYR